MGENKGFTKTDMERVGLFQEMNYTTINDRYRRLGSINFNESAGKGKQMLPGGSKSRSALQTGYFSDKYARVLEGEAHSDPIKMRRQHRLKQAQKNIGKPFLPSNGDKQLSGLGNHYGTFAGPVEAFSPVGKGKQGHKAAGKNFYTNPGKRGTGYGFVGVTISPYQKYAPDAYDRAKELSKRDTETHRKNLKGGAFRLNMHPKSYFDDNPYRGDRMITQMRKDSKGDLKPFKPSSPGKVPAGMKAGTFDPYPSHSADPYGKKYSRPVHVVNKTGKIFMPSAGPKSAPVSSVVDQNVIKAINKQNYKTLSSVMSF